MIGLLPPQAQVLDCSCGTGQLAVGLAGRGLRVIATDASEAMIRRTAELAAEMGAPVRAVRADWSELPDHVEVRATDVPGLFVLPAGAAVDDASRLLGSAAMQRLLLTLSQRYDFVIVDTPPVLAAPDALAVSATVDERLLVMPTLGRP